MIPNPDKAHEILEVASKMWWDPEIRKHDLVMDISQALGYLRGYVLPPEIIAAYRCTFCGTEGVKLWRAIHSDREAGCSRCGTAQAGLPDTINEDGELIDSIDGRPSDQIYSSKQGLNLLPYVPTLDGETWGYTSVPPEGCLWWKSLPTRKP